MSKEKWFWLVIAIIIVLSQSYAIVSLKHQNVELVKTIYGVQKLNSAQNDILVAHTEILRVLAGIDNGESAVEQSAVEQSAAIDAGVRP